MEKIITKTSTQAKIEKEQLRRDTSCPECGNYCLGTVTTITTGLFSVKIQKKHNYNCINCGCEWTTGWV